MVAEFLGEPLDRAASDALIDRIVAHWASDGHGVWAVERKEDGRFLGFVGLAAPSFETAFTPCVEVGWRLANAAWGHGYATEAARAALQFGFQDLDLQEIVSFTTVGNVRSRAVMERLGMTRDPADDFDHPNLPAGHPLRPTSFAGSDGMPGAHRPRGPEEQLLFGERVSGVHSRRCSLAHSRGASPPLEEPAPGSYIHPVYETIIEGPARSLDTRSVNIA